jgi:hypothetical protein
MWTLLASVVLFITPMHGPSRKHRFQQYFYCSMRIRYRGNVFTEPLPTNGMIRHFRATNASTQDIRHRKMLTCQSWLYPTVQLVDASARLVVLPWAQFRLQGCTLSVIALYLHYRACFQSNIAFMLFQRICVSIFISFYLCCCSHTLVLKIGTSSCCYENNRSSWLCMIAPSYWLDVTPHVVDFWYVT